MLENWTGGDVIELLCFQFVFGCFMSDENLLR